jgi:hypothetical protein
MHIRRTWLTVVLLAVATPALAQPAGGGARGSNDRDARRLLQRFVEDAAIIPGAWVEGQYVYQNLPGANSRHFAGPLIAFRLVDNVEAGIRFGYLKVDYDSGPDGSGLSDFDIYAKYRFPGGGARRGAVGALIKVPTADEEEGLGTGKADVEVFGAWRADLEAVSLVGNVGIRFNGNPDPPLAESQDSILLGAALLLPARSSLSFLVEATFESERTEGGDSDARLTLGVQGFGMDRGGGLRGGISIPLSDGAPDYEIIFGAAFVY